ncbi:Nagst-1 protein [Aphelenchoides avenae]|nr:Nagst-1 protein [Aphelenchus avenae]
MVQYKLTYLQIRGLGEPARMILHYANQPFEDVRISREELKELKPKLPYGQVPLLEVDGKPLAQSTAIYRYLARQFGLAGKDDYEAAKLDEFSDYLKDVGREIRGFFQQVLGVEIKDKEKFEREQLRPTVDRLNRQLEEKLANAASGFLAPSGVTWLDFFVTERLYTMQKAKPDLFEAHPKIHQYIQRVHTLPQLKDYIASRLDTEW